MYSRGRTSSRDRSWRAPYCRQNPRQLCCLMKSYRSVCHVEVSLLYLSTALLVGILISQDRSHTSRTCKSFVSFPLRTNVEGRQRIQGHQILLNSELSDKPVAYATWPLNLPPRKHPAAPPSGLTRAWCLYWSSLREQDDFAQVPQPSLVHCAHGFSNDDVRFIHGGQYEGYRGVSQGPSRS